MKGRHWLALLASGVALMGCAGAGDEEAITRLWQEYLESKQGRYMANAGAPSSLWSAAEQAQWPMYDLSGFYLPDGAVPEAVRVTAASGDSVYQVVTRFRQSDAASDNADGRALLTMTVMARREGTGWVLANALPHHTTQWPITTTGPITFHVAPSLSFDSGRASLAAGFVDSLARAFQVPVPRIDYYVAESVDQALAMLGAEFPERFGAAGGFAKPVNGQVFSGIPAVGENYRHELAHVVLYPVVRDAGTSLLASEGVATWLGGTAGGDFQSAVRGLDAVLRARPELTLDAIVDGAEVGSEIRNAAGGVLAQMVHEAGGAEAVRGFLRAGALPAGIRAQLERLLARPWAQIVSDWRATVSRLARSPAPP